MHLLSSCDTRVLVSPFTNTDILRARDAAVTQGERPRKKLGMSMMSARPMMGMEASSEKEEGEVEVQPAKRTRKVAHT